MNNRSTELFREEALTHHQRGSDSGGDVLRISPEWLPASYHLLLIVVAAAITYGTLGTVTEYASGPAVIRVEGRSPLTAPAASTVAAVAVQPGQRVAAGAVLVTFYLADRVAELERLNREFDLQMIKFLRDPADLTSRSALTTLHADRQLARTRHEQQWLKAPHAGIVSDIRIRPGQHLTPGEPVLSLLDDDVKWTVVAVLPGHARPLLRRGTALRIELNGYRYGYHDVAVESIGDEIVGPDEVRQYLGPEIADAVPLEGPAVLVKGLLTSNTFRSDGRTLSYYDGMVGTADARVRQQPILVGMVPALKVLWRHVEY
jgi:membrane fusion protein (multidrug efflux system)